MSNEPWEEASAALDDAYRSFEEGDLESAAALAEEALELLADDDSDETAGAWLDGVLLLARIYVHWQDDEAALECLRLARETDPADRRADLVEGSLRLEKWELDEARRRLEKCRADPELRAEAAYYLAMVAEADGDLDAAERAYREAERLDPENFPAPVRISDEEAHAMVAEVLQSLPEEFQDALDNVVIQLRDLPPRDFRNAPDLLGTHVGVPVGERSNLDAGADLAHILVFKRNLERGAADREEVMEELRVTLLHEIGHHLGFDEEGVEELGLG